MAHTYSGPGGGHDESHPHPAGHGSGHESKDVRLKGLMLSTVALVLVTVAIQLVLGIWMGFYTREDERILSSRIPKQIDEAGQFPGPRLQGNPGADMVKYRAEERKVLASESTDRAKGTAQIPIARAMELIERKGLPVRKSEETPK